MRNKDTENESIGIIAVVIIVILAAIGVYYFFSSHRPPTALNADTNAHVPLEAPLPVQEDK